MPGGGNGRQHVRRGRCCNQTCFVEEIWAYGPGKPLDSIEAFEQRLPRTRVVLVGFNPGDAQESGRACRRVRLFRLRPGMKLL